MHLWLKSQATIHSRFERTRLGRTTEQKLRATTSCNQATWSLRLVLCVKFIWVVGDWVGHVKIILVEVVEANVTILCSRAK